MRVLFVQQQRLLHEQAGSGRCRPRVRGRQGGRAVGAEPLAQRADGTLGQGQGTGNGRRAPVAL